MRQNSETPGYRRPQVSEVKIPFSMGGRMRSFVFALHGLTELIRTQHNMWIHLLVTLAVITAGVFFQLDTFEWCFVIFAIVLVWIAEALNTAIEFLCDVFSPSFHPKVKKSKDIAAGAVLISAIGATAIGCVIFIPYLYEMF